jgi:hypothetical protein
MILSHATNTVIIAQTAEGTPTARAMISLIESLEPELVPGRVDVEGSTEDVVVFDVKGEFDGPEFDVLSAVDDGVTVPYVTCPSLPNHRGRYIVEVTPIYESSRGRSLVAMPQKWL